MRPNEHYIPLKKDLSDLFEKLEWVKANDEKVEQIAQSGSKAALEILTPETILCYYAEAFHTYR